MAEFVFSRQFLTELAEWEGTSSAADRTQLDDALSRIARNPELPGRIPAYYDPAKPSSLYRAGPILLHYRISGHGVIFLNMFYQRVR